MNHLPEQLSFNGRNQKLIFAMLDYLNEGLKESANENHEFVYCQPASEFWLVSKSGGLFAVIRNAEKDEPQNFTLRQGPQDWKADPVWNELSAETFKEARQKAIRAAIY